MLRLALASALSLACVIVTHARDQGQWKDLNSATTDWFKHLRNFETNIPCCDYADGMRLEDPDYRENPDGSYEVFIRNEWRHVDKSQVINPVPRFVDYAIIWWADGIDHPYCFMPGTRG